jgi:hypothetical protein
LTLKYLLSNERLDIFWPDVKPRLNSFLDETEKWKKRNASGEAKFQDTCLTSDSQTDRNTVSHRAVVPNLFLNRAKFLVKK